MHAAAFAAAGIPGTYQAFDVAPAALAAFLESARSSLDGFNVTVPHKVAVFGALDAVDAHASIIGAVNTVRNVSGRLEGTNTDAPGFIHSLARANIDAAGSDVLVLGAGGAARAAIVGLADAGARRIAVLARRPEAEETLVRELEARGVAPGTLSCSSAASAPAFSPELIVNASSAGMGVHAGTGEFERLLATFSTLPWDRARFAADLVYVPGATAFLAAATRAGVRGENGLSMLAAQGALAFEAWTGVPAERVMGAMLRTLAPA
jgi:shikimate dehydrogenase